MSWLVDVMEIKKGFDIAEKIRELYEITRELEDQFPGRRFTPDGHLVGSIGEVLAADYYGLTLLPNSTETHDALSDDGRSIQIKATQINRISISSEPDYLIVIQITERGAWKEIYNGPGAVVWNNAGKLQKNGQRPITLAKLRSLAAGIPESERIRSRCGG